MDRWWPSSKTCSNCGWQHPSLTLADRTFHCTNCGLTMDRDLNAALNIERHTESPNVAADRGETENARRAPVRLPGPRAREQGAAKREDAGPFGPAPPGRSNPPTLPLQRHEQVELF
ncbi:zinc ribbon domain-containing protein [Streptomyces sp. NPDC059122]|uniref:zinc ribbon domain-containing protein n=1 Tax=Streptomyces sp. NPDC059122 TaxID=3346732 RepID=UPI003680A029